MGTVVVVTRRPNRRLTPPCAGVADGTRSTLARHGFDRLWRDGRTHMLHGRVRWKYHAVGQFYLNGVPPLHS